MNEVETMEEEDIGIPEPMTDGEVLVALDEEIRRAGDLVLDELTGNQRDAWSYFAGDAPGELDEDVDETFTTVVSRDVANAIEATLAEILPAFATERPAEFDSEGPGDEDQAVLESDICNDILMESGSGYLELSTAAKDALLLRIGVLEIMWDDRIEVEYRTMPGVPETAVEQILSEPMTELVEYSDAGIGPDGVPIYDLQIKTARQISNCRVESVPVDELLISSDSTSLDLDRSRFVARKTPVSRSELIASGYDPEIVDQLSAYTSTVTTAATARERDVWGRDKYSGDRATDLILTCRCYYRLDEDRDGIAELRRIVVGGMPGAWRILEDEPVDYQPFAAGSGYVWPHMPYGISLFDKLRNVQDLKTKFWRILLEAGQRAARDRVGLLPGVNAEDWEATQFGGAVRMNSPNSILPIPTQAFPAPVEALQGMADRARREGGGGAIDKSAQENLPVEAGAHGVERFMSAIEEANAMVARTLAETMVRQAYLKIHHVLRLYSGPISRKVSGQWAQIDPRQWQPRTKVSVATGLTLSERQRLAQAYGMLVGQQQQLMEKGSNMASEQTLYRAIVAQARMLGVANPESYIVDPDSQEAQQAAQQKQQAAKQQQQAQHQAMMQQIHAQTQMLVQVEMAKNQGRLQTTQLQEQGDMQAAILKAQSDMERTMAEIAAKLETDSEKLGVEYDKLRVELLELKAKYNTEGANVLRNE